MVKPFPISDMRVVTQITDYLYNPVKDLNPILKVEELFTVMEDGCLFVRQIYKVNIVVTEKHLNSLFVILKQS